MPAYRKRGLCMVTATHSPLVAGLKIMGYAVYKVCNIGQIDLPCL